jgi:excisionase family DNA binding protein
MTTAVAEKDTATPTNSDLPVIRWLSSAEAAQYLGIHVNHLRTISAGRLPYYNMAGRLRRYRLEDVDAFIEASRVTG